MDRKKFMKELEYLLQDINDDDRSDALSFYESYFDEAGKENETRVIEELGEPSRVAAIIKDGLQGSFDNHINVGNAGFSDDDYKRNYEIIDVEVKEEKRKSEKTNRSNFKGKWSELESRDKTILIVLAILICVPMSFPMFGIFGLFGGLFGAGFSIFSVFLCFIFGFWIITFILYMIGIVLMVIGVISLFTIPGAGFIYIGVACILIALAHIFSRIAVWFFRDFIPGIIDAIGTGFAKIFHKEAKS